MRKILFCCAAACFWCATGNAAATEVFGSYASGCIRGAVPLQTGSGFQLQRWGPGRNYGHPELIDYLLSLVNKAKSDKLPDLLIGDLSKRYGGSFGKSSAHGSHNVGLDADISFDFATPKKSAYELSHPKDVYLVDAKQRPTSNFDSLRIKLIYLAAQDVRVERIFVAPGIKRKLCELYGGRNDAWLAKLRPWFGHRGHMHVRLKCPTDSPNCQSQSPVPEGDGCGYELESWFNPPSRNNQVVSKSQSAVPKVKKNQTPKICSLVLKGR